jgi:hypothetical protein
MLKTFDIIMIMVMISAAAVTFRIKANSEAELREVRQLERQIAHEEDNLDILDADWALLTQPSRIQKLVDAHRDALGMHPTDSSHVTTVDAVPEKGLVPESDPIADAIAASEGQKSKQVAKQDKPVEAQPDAATTDDVDTDTDTGSIEQ